MSIGSISGSSSGFNSSGVNSKAGESLQQLAAQGDQTAIAELKQQQELENPTQPVGATEPGKGEQIDQYI